MPLRAQQLWATAVALPRLVTPAPMAWVAGAGVVVVALGSSPASIVLHTRMAGTLVAAAAAGLLDDTAAVTLAPSPTPLLARRSFRIAVLGVLAGTWWAAMLLIAAGRGAEMPAVALTREATVLLAVSIVGAVAVQRRGGDGGSGALGGLFAIGWFALSFLPRSSWLPSPPDPLDPDAATPLSLVLLIAAAATVALSRDQAAGAREYGLAARTRPPRLCPPLLPRAAPGRRTHGRLTPSRSGRGHPSVR